MFYHALLAFLSILVTIACCLLGILIISLRNWKKDIKEDIAEFCASNKEAHEEIWQRVNHHWHNGGGNVVIPTPGLKGG